MVSKPVLHVLVGLFSSFHEGLCNRWLLASRAFGSDKKFASTMLPVRRPVLCIGVPLAIGVAILHGIIDRIAEGIVNIVLLGVVFPSHSPFLSTDAQTSYNLYQ